MLNLKSIALIAVAGIISAGCQTMKSEMSGLTTNPVAKLKNAPPDELNDTPLIVDGAMQLRNWPRVSSVYANGDTPAGPTGFWYEPAWNQSGWKYPVIETPLFLVQTVALPVTLSLTPPWSEATYTGATISTTYTAMPLLPGSASVPHTDVIAAPATQP